MAAVFHNLRIHGHDPHDQFLSGFFEGSLPALLDGVVREFLIRILYQFLELAVDRAPGLQVAT
jgi:hypothetical protein